MCPYIWDTALRIKTFSTRQAGKMFGIGSSTLFRYIAAEKIPAPKAIQLGGMTVHLWTSQEVERVRKLLPTIEDGRTTRHQKQVRKD